MCLAFTKAAIFGIVIFCGLSGKTRYVSFLPRISISMSVPGMWKLAVYEIPTKVDDTGKVTKTARFEFRQNLINTRILTNKKISLNQKC